MLDKLRQSKLMFWSVELLVLATLIFVSSKIQFLFKPIGTLFSTLFAPILIGGFFYYMTNPLVSKLEKRFKMKRIWAIVLVLLLMVGLIAVLLGAVVPGLIRQVSQLAAGFPDFIKAAETWSKELMTHPMFQRLDFQEYLDKMDMSFGHIAKLFMNSLSNGLGSFVSVIANATVILVTVPFVLFYMLKDGHKFVPALSKYLPRNQKDEVVELLHKMSETISKYISGQAVECLFVAVGTFLGYQLVGVPYAFLFGFIAGVANMIPYLGPYIGLAPALVVTVVHSPVKALLACVVVLIVQQIDGNIIYPNVIGKSLDIHPLTIILILLVAGNMAGLLGMILGVPFYAVCRTVFLYVFDILRLNRDKEGLDKSQTKE
ncbi:AI-2E family transporter [Vagococcus humatus]|uniref:AI-2E family transporter n=1 Tax=Vagococcus humatus TaxID=1889241 RepID=A0A429Z879_9ENTE|nr:AI-2E family transporter [Vagococcus humatus]RST89929.1 AI-2E family transporter [Vagococcus humatus]